MVTVIGLGFVGLTTALGFAKQGIPVYGVEADPLRLGRIASGTVPFEEPHLQEILSEQLGKNFFPCGECEKAIQKSEFVFFCVGTPCGEDGEADLSVLFAAMRQTFSALKDQKRRILVMKSTIPPSTTRDRIRPFLEKEGFRIPQELGLAVNPEFLREGHCWEDFVHADRIVLGVEDKDEETRQRLFALYEPLGIPAFAVSPNTAEFIKYCSNSVLAVLISFANEMSLAAEAFGDIDIADAFRILQMDHRWQTGGIRSYFYPGTGYGGYCLPKDTKAFHAAAEGRGAATGILEEAIRVNDEMPARTARKIMRAAGEPERCIGILGLAFNAGSDDVRGAVSAEVIRTLNAAGYRNLVAYDPLAMENFRNAFPVDCRYAESAEAVLAEADIVAVLTRWAPWRELCADADKPVVDCVHMMEGQS